MSSASAEAGLPAPPPPRAGVMSILSRIGRSLMLPIAALPAAALLRRLGQDDLLGRTHNAALDKIAEVVGGAGTALFDNLPLLFAIGVAIGYARRSDGSTGLAALIGYLVFDRVSKLLFFDASGYAVHDRVAQTVLDAEGRPAQVINLAAGNPTGVLGGIVIGLVTAVLYQRYHRIKLPTWLAFFGGRRFVPIVTAFAALVLGVVFGVLWQPVGEWMTAFGGWLADHSTAGAGIYGVANRLLIPFGLHHFLNSMVWFQVPDCTVGGRQFAGDLTCYLQGNPGSGEFMAGFFPVIMFGLPAAAIAIWRAAPPHRRRAVGGIMISAALVAFVTGITEPIEFAFIFVAPLLFVIHALLTGVSMALVAAMDGHLGFGFSAGVIDAALNATKSNTDKFWQIMVLGLIYAAVYYAVFTFLIKRLNILTPGREPEPDPDAGEPAAPASRNGP
ncbi:PTS sugar transporter subunit IIA [Sphaerisporangium siamense]|uniref:PTS system N-acetylglucosamine-specific IIC component n=1 Tax=Sphaerisporangium siamense TaxID=795645 RepID=A0A7W7GG90_9ACTN|nr:PTS transporter subunit EIIC [Sphaerisporangium siamense]MBB4705836.1 PTS system N-acetylglucosamine-specific IIC component [Sphaerisporangium siamense]GII82771.1 PTS sugar transporter subunit IIA [Sphaerisporangium siamense]